MNGFFQPADAVKERLYSDIARAPNRYFRKARRSTERMWSSCGQFVDCDAPERARKDDFYPVWWELYLAYALSTAGVSLVSSKDRPQTAGDGRPDLLACNPRVWIEAVMPQPGIGADALVEPAEGVFEIPVDKFVLRLATALQEKVAKVARYIDDGTIPASEAIIIAVSGGRLPFRFQEYPIPNIVRALCGAGFLGMELDIQSKQRLGTYAEFRDHIDKKSKAPVPTDLFLKKECAYVSAVLYSNADCVNYPRRQGAEFVLVHNPHANVPLTDTWLPLGQQYWIQDGALRRKGALQF